jgi:hypothetical protein
MMEMFTPIATSIDDDGKEFMAAWEAKDYPFYSTIFHPEKPWTSFSIGYGFNHSFDSHRINRQFADFFVAQARKNSNHFDNYDQELMNLITHHKVLVTKKYAGSQYAFLKQYQDGDTEPTSIFPEFKETFQTQRPDL